VFVLLILIVVSCQKAQPDITQAPTKLTITSPLFPTVNNLIQTPLPYNPVQLATVASTKIAIETAYKLPLWMGSPDTVILMDFIIEAMSFKLLFLNALTGEKFYFPIPTDAGKYFWFDNMHFGFLSNDLKYMYVIDASEGLVSTIQVSENSTRFLDLPGDIRALEVEHNPTQPDDYIFDYAHEVKNEQYSAYRDTSAPGFPITILSRDNGETVWQSSSIDGLWESEFAWSPVNDRIIAMVRGIPDERDYYGMLIKSKVMQLIDVKTNQIVSSFSGDFNEIVWSPNGENILYQHAISLDTSIGYGFRDAPCILNIGTGINKCLPNIPSEHIPDGAKLQTTANYSWSRDGGSIRYIYQYSFHPDEHNQKYADLCIYSLMTGTIACPTDNLVELKGRSILNYDFSPDEEFIYFCYSVNSLFSDDQTGQSNDAIVDVDGRRFTAWAGQIFSGVGPETRCSNFGPMWRPTP